MKFICPIIATYAYVINCYVTPSKLFMVSWGEILSSEGRTQGEPIAKRAYTLGILPLIKFLLESINLKNKNAKEVAFAGDFPGTDSLNSIKNYYDNSAAIGPKYGYFPKLNKIFSSKRKQHD